MICDTLQHLTRYKGLHPNLDTAIDYLLTHDPGPAAGTHRGGRREGIHQHDGCHLAPDAGYHPEYHKLYADLQLDLPAARAGALPQIPAGRSAILPATAVFRTAPAS